MRAPVRVVARGVAVGAVLAALAGCGGANRPGEEGALESANVISAPDLVASTTTTIAPPTTEAAAVARPRAPWESLVAVARPEVSELELFDAPNGQRLSFELPMVNPWYFGGELALLVTSGRDSDPWLQVAVPTRPNGTTAWIRAADVTIRTHRVHAEIAVSSRRLRVWDGETMLVDTTIVVGRPSTPTPLGQFFVNARIKHSNPGGAYGPWILSLSGFSEALDNFDGGLPEIAIHGTNQPALLGQARSNGCIRVRNDVIEQLANAMPLGTPVDIVA